VTFVVNSEILVRVVVRIVLLQELSRNKELGTLLAFDLLGFLTGWKLQQILVGCDCFLLQF
jgi:hypothetical protein